MDTDVFVTRNFELGGVTVPVRFFRPVPEEVDFRCDYEIDFPSWQRKFHGYGVDEVQALLSAMSAAHVDLLAMRRDDRLDFGSKVEIFIFLCPKTPKRETLTPSTMANLLMKRPMA